VLALRNSYHGRSFAAMGVTDVAGWSASNLSPFDVTYVPNGSRYRSGMDHLSDAAFIDACVDELRSVIEVSGARDAACLIAEPIQGVGGFTLPPDGYFRAVQSVLDEYGILLISDEVQTGWGRTGEHFWGMDAHGVVPDAMTFAKGLGNGLAIGGVVARGELMDCLTANSISTFGGNPLAAAGALANLQYLLDNDLQENARRVGASIMTRLREHTANVPIVGDVRGKGLMIGIELVKAGGDEPDPAAAAAVLERTRARGLLIGKGGPYGSVLRVTPPLSVSQAEADEGIDILLSALDEQ
jgi:4-aminobutyrate aminotransferase